MKFEVEYIEKLSKLVSDNGLTEISLEDGEQAITIRKDLPEVVAQTVSTPIVSSPVAQTSSASAAQVEKTETSHKGKAIVSPMVGTFYSASSPETDAFVEVGKDVSKGDVVCIIEAMKLMNEIEADIAGKVVEICVEDGQPVEFGQVLMYVE